MSLRTFRRTIVVASLAVVGATAQTVWAADPSPDPNPTATFQRERAACLEGRTQQSQADCLKEARNALADKRRGVLDNAGNFDADKHQRCNYVPADQREDCMRIADGEGTQSGSVEGGGILKELVTRSVGEPGSTPQPQQ
jgi:hypothetical protein